MRHRIVMWTLVLHALPGIAAAAGAAGPTIGQAVADPATARERPAADFLPALDLRIVPRQPPTAPAGPLGRRAIGAERVDRYSAAEPDTVEEGLSFGIEVRRRPQLESRARPEEDDAPGLQDDIQRAIEHSTLGVRGSYRF